jgi:Transglutaminase-like superfamily
MIRAARECASMLLAFGLLVWFRVRVSLPWASGARAALGRARRATPIRALPVLASGSTTDLQRLFARVRRWPVGRVLCLPRSLALARFLELHGVAARVCLGFGRRADRLAGHAWVEHDGAVIGDEPGFVAAFARLRPIGLEGDNR